MTQIPFVDLKAQFARLEKDIRARMDRVLIHGRFILGPEIFELEKALADFAGVRYAVTCASGTDALLMPLMAWDIGPGDAVFTTPFTFIATAEVIAMTRATPVFVDIDPRTFNIDPEKLEQSIHKTLTQGRLKPRAVIPVDLFGLPADYDRIMPIAESCGMMVLEDAAQGFGGTYKGRRAGSLANAGATSFFPAKPLGCYGDGGAVLTDDEDLFKKLESIRVHGKGEDKYDNVRLGLNARMDTLQAAILLPKLAIFEDELAARQRVADCYTKNLEEVVKTPHVPKESTSAWAQYSVLSSQRGLLQDALKKAEIPSAVYYPRPLHLQGAFSDLGYKAGDFPVSEAAADQIFSLPMHPYLGENDLARVTETICNAAAL